MAQGPEYWLPGVLSKDQLRYLHKKNLIEGIVKFDKAAGYSSIDLHLSDMAWELIDGSIKPSKGDYLGFLQNEHLAKKLPPDESHTFTLQKNKCYIFKLREKINPGPLSKLNIFGQATAKSTIGRLDIIARLVVDGMQEYDQLNPKKIMGLTRGDLYLEIIPISFNIRVKEGVPMSQLRFFKGDPNLSLINDKEFIKAILIGGDGESFLSVDLTNIDIAPGLKCAYLKAINNSEPIDLWKKDPHEKPKPCEYWCWDITETKNANRLKIIKDQFYLLRSKERIYLPSGVAVSARAMDETLGEMRIHYAGFVHPFFGMERKDQHTGTPLIFEVRGHSVDVNLSNHERLAKLNFYRMSEVANREKKDEDPEEDPEKEKYNNQELTLSKYFGEWPKECTVDSQGIISEKIIKKKGE